MNKKKIDNGVVQVVTTEIGKIGVNTRTGNILGIEKICQKCSKVLSATDYFDYICNQCDHGRD